MTEPRAADVICMATDVGIDGADRERRQARWTLAVSAAALVIVPAVAMVLGSSLGIVLVVVLGLPALLGAVHGLASLAIGQLDAGRRLAPGSVEVREGALHVHVPSAYLRREIPLADVVQGFVEGPDLVLIATRDEETVVVRAVDSAAAGQLLAACGVTAAERVMRVPLASAATRIPGGRVLGWLAIALVFVGMVAGGVVLGGEAHRVLGAPDLPGGLLLVVGVSVLALLGALGLLLVRAVSRREAVVGTDGLVVRGTFSRQLVPFSDVARVVRDRRGVRIACRGARDVLLRTLGAEQRPLRDTDPPPGAARSAAEARRDALLDRIRAAMALHAEGEARRVGLEELDRRGRPLAVWRADLQRLLARETDYRRAGLTPADLGAAIEDASAPPGRRIAATVALFGVAPDDARRRARNAAQAAADDDLRVALEKAAEGEIDEGVVATEERRA